MPSASAACASATNGSTRRSASPVGHRAGARASAACRPPRRRSPARSCGPSLPASTSSISSRGGAASPPSILPTATQMSRPTVSASSIGPIGMPNASAASSTVSGAMPSSTQRIAAIRYGASTRLTRKPGALLHRQRQLVDLAHERRGRAARGRRASAAPTTISTSIICATGLKKCRPISRDGSAQRARRSPRAGCSTCWCARIAPGFAFFSSAANSAAWPRRSRRSPR